MGLTHTPFQGLSAAMFDSHIAAMLRLLSVLAVMSAATEALMKSRRDEQLTLHVAYEAADAVFGITTIELELRESADPTQRGLLRDLRYDLALAIGEKRASHRSTLAALNRLRNILEEMQEMHSTPYTTLNPPSRKEAA